MSNFNSSEDNSSAQSNHEQESNKVALNGNSEADLLRQIEQTLESLDVLVDNVSSSCLISSITPSLTQIASDITEHDKTQQNSEIEDKNTVSADEFRHNFLETISFLSTKTEDNKKEIYQPPILIQSVQNDDTALSKQKESDILECSIPELLQETYGTDDEDLPMQTSSQPTTNRYVEPTVSTLEREILLRGELCENRKTKILQLPPDLISHTGSCDEREIVGDDVAHTINHIFCECEQPGVSGGAVPVVTSFTKSGKDPDPNDNDKPKSDSGNSLLKKGSCSDTNQSKPRPSSIPILSNSFRTEKPNFVTPSEKNCPDSSTSSNASKQSKNTSSKRVSLPERASVKNSSGVSIAKKEKDDEEVKECPEHDIHTRYKQLTNEFSKQVSRLAQEASSLAEIKSPSAQTAAIDSLYHQIINLRKVANDLKVLQSKNASDTLILDQSLNVDETQANVEMNNKLKIKDNNRIYIKFLPTKSAVKKRKSCNSEVQTDFDYMLDQETLMPPNDELYTRPVDSVDGMFIPSNDDPPKMDDEEDDGLDITITFPELQNNIQEDSSHLSVCFSSISAEALGRLKRCPKEFTLHMDFIQGKMFFQSGKSPANNFAIGPDLKITECAIDTKQSAIINIKPSTECLYTSQIIAVESESARKNSIKILRSTDSELFNVVSLPYVNKKTSVATKSCITFKNLRRVSSESLLPDRTYYKSMPQIPSLTKILEEPSIDCVVGGIRAAMTNNEKKPRTRTFQKKRTNASLENILNDTI